MGGSEAMLQRKWAICPLHADRIRVWALWEREGHSLNLGLNLRRLSASASADKSASGPCSITKSAWSLAAHSHRLPPFPAVSGHTILHLSSARSCRELPPYLAGLHLKTRSEILGASWVWNSPNPALLAYAPLLPKLRDEELQMTQDSQAAARQSMVSTRLHTLQMTGAELLCI